MNQLTDVLKQFEGKTPDDIAEIMRRRKIKGRMGTTYDCPMALLLDGVSTGRYVIGRKYIVRQSGKVIQKSRTPDNVATFVRKFDVGDYPDLVAPPPRCMVPRGEPRAPHGRADDRTQRDRKRVIKNHIRKLVGRFSEVK